MCYVAMEAETGVSVCNFIFDNV